MHDSHHVAESSIEYLVFIYQLMIKNWFGAKQYIAENIHQCIIPDLFLQILIEHSLFHTRAFTQLVRHAENGLRESIRVSPASSACSDRACR